MVYSLCPRLCIISLMPLYSSLRSTAVFPKKAHQHEKVWLTNLSPLVDVVLDWCILWKLGFNVCMFVGKRVSLVLLGPSIVVHMLSYDQLASFCAVNPGFLWIELSDSMAVKVPQFRESYPYRYQFQERYELYCLKFHNQYKCKLNRRKLCMCRSTSVVGLHDLVILLRYFCYQLRLSAEHHMRVSIKPPGWGSVNLG